MNQLLDLSRGIAGSIEQRPEPSAPTVTEDPLRYVGFEVGYLHSSNRLIARRMKRLEEWTVNRAIVYPRRVVAASLRRGASGFVPADNQPNEKVLPSEQHWMLGRALVLGSIAAPQIKFIGHFVLISAACVSVRREELL